MLPPAGSAQLSDFAERAMRSDSREFLAVRNYLNFLEDLCSGVTLNVFDEQVIFRSIGGRLSRAWHTFNTWIMAEREKLDQVLFEELEATVAAYDARGA